MTSAFMRLKVDVDPEGRRTMVDAEEVLRRRLEAEEALRRGAEEELRRLRAGEPVNTYMYTALISTRSINAR